MLPASNSIRVTDRDIHNVIARRRELGDAIVEMYATAMKMGWESVAEALQKDIQTLNNSLSSDGKTRAKIIIPPTVHDRNPTALMQLYDIPVPTKKRNARLIDPASIIASSPSSSPSSSLLATPTSTTSSSSNYQAQSASSKSAYMRAIYDDDDDSCRGERVLPDEDWDTPPTNTNESKMETSHSTLESESTPSSEFPSFQRTRSRDARLRSSSQTVELAESNNSSIHRGTTTTSTSSSQFATPTQKRTRPIGSWIEGLLLSPSIGPDSNSPTVSISQPNLNLKNRQTKSKPIFPASPFEYCRKVSDSVNKPFECTWPHTQKTSATVTGSPCGRSFSTLQACEEHARTHMGLSKYHCECGYVSNDHSNFGKHLRKYSHKASTTSASRGRPKKKRAVLTF